MFNTGAEPLNAAWRVTFERRRGRLVADLLLRASDTTSANAALSAPRPITRYMEAAVHPDFY
jgi:hypothetical protein